MTATAKTKYRFVGQHLDDLADGRILEPGEAYTLTPDEIEDPHNQQRISDGLLLELPAPRSGKEG